MMNGMSHRMPAACVMAIALMALVVALRPSEVRASRISLNGTSGLLMTPSASLVEDRHVAAGVSFVDRKWAVEGRDQYDNLAYFGTIGFLPRLEVSFRLTVLLGSMFSPEEPDRSVKDRMLSVKALLLRENGPWPSLAVGAEDITGTRRYNTLFAVLGERIMLGPAGEFEFHLGAGASWMDAKNHPLEGVFGGMTKRLWRGGEFLIEYDTSKVNIGLGAEPFRYIRVLLAAMNAESFAGSFHIQFNI